jgi:hypothetical protein
MAVWQRDTYEIQVKEHNVCIKVKTRETEHLDETDPISSASCAARQFRVVAIPLADMAGPEPNWPKLFLLTRAIELVRSGGNSLLILNGCAETKDSLSERLRHCQQRWSTAALATPIVGRDENKIRTGTSRGDAAAT